MKINRIIKSVLVFIFTYIVLVLLLSLNIKRFGFDNFIFDLKNYSCLMLIVSLFSVILYNYNKWIEQKLGKLESKELKKEFIIKLLKLYLCYLVINIFFITGLASIEGAFALIVLFLQFAMLFGFHLIFLVKYIIVHKKKI